MENYIDEINRKFNYREITLEEKNRLIKEYKTTGQKKEFEIPKAEILSDRELQEQILKAEILSDRELQEQILKTLKLNQEDNRTIKFWVVFWSWLSIIGLVIYIITLIAILK